MHAQGFFENNILQTLAYVEDAASNNTVYPLYIIQGVAVAISCAHLPACMHAYMHAKGSSSVMASACMHARMHAKGSSLPCANTCQCFPPCHQPHH
jgi:hypothetical protein